MIQSTWRLLLGVLLGMLVFGFVSTGAVFGVRESLGLSSRDAGTIAGAILGRLDVLALGLLLVLVALQAWLVRRGEAGSAGFWVTLALAGMLALTLVEIALITPRIAALRDAIQMQFGGMENAPPEFRRAFGIWHGVSMLRALLVAIIGAVAWLLEALAARRRPA